MKSAKIILVAIVAIVLINIAVPEIFSFFVIPYESYSTYLHWFTMLGILFILLPDKKGSIFIKN